VYRQHAGWQLSLYTRPSGFSTTFTNDFFSKTYPSVPNAERSQKGSPAASEMTAMISTTLQVFPSLLTEMVKNAKNHHLTLCVFVCRPMAFRV
jgi:hypothetical protein